MSTSTYKVVSGDTLSEIAERLLGDASRWPELYELNKDKIKHPSMIYPDQVLTLPEGCYDMSTRITAGKLRELGLKLPPEIPDCAHVPRSSIEVKKHPVHAVDITKTGVVKMPLMIQIHAPFEWINVEVTATRAN